MEMGKITFRYHFLHSIHFISLSLVYYDIFNDYLTIGYLFQYLMFTQLVQTSISLIIGYFEGFFKLAVWADWQKNKINKQLQTHKTMTEDTSEISQFNLDLSHHLSRSLNTSTFVHKQEQALYSTVIRQLHNILNVLQQEIKDYKTVCEKEKLEIKQDLQLKDQLILCLSKINVKLLIDNQRLKRQIYNGNQYLAQRIADMEKKHLQQREQWQRITENLQNQLHKMLTAIKDTTQVISQNFGVNCLRIFNKTFEIEGVQSIKENEAREVLSQSAGTHRNSVLEKQEFLERKLIKSLCWVSSPSKTRSKRENEQNFDLSIQDSRRKKQFRMDDKFPGESTLYSNPESKDYNTK